MSKAVLVMDMPRRCSECRLCLRVPQKNGLALCLGLDDNKPTEYNPKREAEWLPEWCPLNPMPQIDNRNVVNTQYQRGWNACINALGGISNE